MQDTEKKADCCPECNSRNIIQDSDTKEIVCGDCGLVVENTSLDLGYERRAYDQKQRSERARASGSTTLLTHDGGIGGTKIGKHKYDNTDRYGRRIDPKDAAVMRRLRKVDYRSRFPTSREKNLSKALSYLSMYFSGLNLNDSKLMENASLIYRNAMNAKMVKGRSIVDMVGACVYLAIRQDGRCLRSLNEVSALAERNRWSTKKSISKAYRFIDKEFGCAVGQPDDMLYLNRIIGLMRLDGEDMRTAYELMKKVKDARIDHGKNPFAMAAAVLYQACKMMGKNVTQKKIADAAGITEVTVRNRYKDIVRGVDLDEVYLD